MTRIKSTFLASLAVLLSPMAAQADIIAFESAATGTCQVTAGGSIDGFTLGAYDGDSGGGFNNADTQGGGCELAVPDAYSGTNYMLNFNSVIAEFTRDVGTFDLISLFVHSDSRSGDSTVRFQGLDGIGGSILYSIDVAITASWQQVSFSGWTGVKTFTWDSLVPGTSNIGIDDFEYNAQSVPEPGTLALLGIGLLGMGAARRRRKA